jgi:hypothetical protein
MTRTLCFACFWFVRGSKKAKICVSVNKKNWHSALARWQKKGSWLVDWLILGYVKRGDVGKPAGAT